MYTKKRIKKLEARPVEWGYIIRSDTGSVIYKFHSHLHTAP